MPTEEDQQKQQPGTEVKQQDHNQSQSTAAATVVPPTASNQDHRQDQESKPRASETPQDVAAEHEQKSDPLCKVKRESVEAAEESEQDDEEDKKQGSVAVKTELATVKEESKPDDVALSLKVEPKKSVPSPTSQDGSAVSVAPSGGDPPVDEDEEDDEEDDDETGDHEDQDEQQRRRQVQGSKQQHQQQHQKPPQSRSGAGYGHDEEANQHDVVHRQDQAQTPTGGQYYEDDEEDDEDEGEEPSELRQLFEPINDSQALSEDEEDGDYIPDEEVKKTIMVGSDFQAVIPEGLCRYDDALPYENEDKLLWNPTILNEQEIEDYLVKITGPPGGVGGPAGQPKGPAGGGGGGGQTPGGGVTPGSGAGDPQSNSVYAIPLGNHLRDDEQSLYLLQQCGHNIDEALRRRRISNNAVPVPEQQMSIWSEEECRNFENGLRVHGKDFHMIQQTKVRTRSVGELVQFYYLWKKTERHDLFASKARLEKKKYNLHPGLTDHMDRFLEEQENSTGFGDRSSSPGFNSLYSSASEAKRQRLLDSKENNTTASSKRSASNL